MNGLIFISYRRDDSLGSAGRIYDRLLEYFPSESIFMDVDVIEPGQDFVEAIGDAVNSCDVAVTIIGSRWLDIVDEDGNRRLDLPEDFVRVEIAAALSSNIRVIPVLVQGATMPRSSDLPDDLKPLSRRNAIEIRHSSFNADTGKLIRALKKIIDESENRRKIEAKRIAAEKEERERIENERRKAERLAAEREEQERKAQIRAEAERIARENAEIERKRKAQLRAEKWVELQRRIKQILPSISIIVAVIGITGFIVLGINKIPEILSIPTSSQTHAMETQKQVSREIDQTEAPSAIPATFSVTPEKGSSKTPSPTASRTSRPTNTSTKIPTNIPVSAMMYSEDFEDGDAQGWTESIGTQIVKVDSDGNQYFQIMGPTDYPQSWLDSDYIDMSNWKDYAFETRVRFVTGALFMCARADGGSAFYTVFIDSGNNNVSLSEYDPSQNVDWGGYDINEKHYFRNNEWYTFRFELNGNVLSFFIDNELVLSTQANLPLVRESGGIGFYTRGGEEVHLDDIRVWELP